MITARENMRHCAGIYGWVHSVEMGRDIFRRNNVEIGIDYTERDNVARAYRAYPMAKGERYPLGVRVDMSGSSRGVVRDWLASGYRGN